jgi:transcriptional regulator with XRE-family HTH domain
MGRLWDLIQKHIDNQPYPVSERTIAQRLKVAPNALVKWRDPKRLPSRENLQAIADLVGVRYSVVLDAALFDTGYHEGSNVAVLRDRREPEPDPDSPDRETWLALQALQDAEDAIRAGRLRNSPALLTRLRRELADAESAAESRPNELP